MYLLIVCSCGVELCRYVDVSKDLIALLNGCIDNCYISMLRIWEIIRDCTSNSLRLHLILVLGQSAAERHDIASRAIMYACGTNASRGWAIRADRDHGLWASILPLL